MKYMFRLMIANVRRFLIGGLTGGGLFLLLVGGLCYLMVREEPSWQVTLVAVLVAVATALSSLLCGARYAATETLREWVDATGVGPMLSKVIFKQALGVSDKRPTGSKEIATQLEGATLGEAKAKVGEKLGELFHSGALDRWLPQQGRWIAKKLTSTAGWAVTSSLLEHFDIDGPDNQPIDLLALRSGMAEGLHEKAVGLVTARATVVVSGAIVLAGLACLATATILSQV